MVTTLRDGAIIRKYSDKVEIIQLFADIPANITVGVSYKPPDGYAILIITIAGGDQINNYLVAKVYLDGTSFFQVQSCGWTDNMYHEEYATWYAKHEIIATITNTDAIMHSTDWGLIGYLVPESMLLELLKELRDDGLKEKLDKTNELLTDIRDWFMKPLKK